MRTRKNRMGLGFAILMLAWGGFGYETADAATSTSVLLVCKPGEDLACGNNRCNGSVLAQIGADSKSEARRLAKNAANGEALSRIQKQLALQCPTDCPGTPIFSPASPRVDGVDEVQTPKRRPGSGRTGYAVAWWKFEALCDSETLLSAASGSGGSPSPGDAGGQE